MNEGTMLLALSRLASATCGFGIGFCGLRRPARLAPIAGCAWHCAQLLPLKVGPKPMPGSPVLPLAEFTSIKRTIARLKKDCSLGLKPGTDPPLLRDRHGAQDYAEPQGFPRSPSGSGRYPLLLAICALQVEPPYARDTPASAKFCFDYWEEGAELFLSFDRRDGNYRASRRTEQPRSG